MSFAGSSLAPAGARPPRRGRYFALAAVGLPFIAVVVFAVLAVSSHASVVLDSSALARVNMPLGGGAVQRLTVIGGREQKLVPVALRGAQVWPTGLVHTGESVTVEVTIKRPGWLSWLTGSTERVRLTLKTPGARLRSQYLTVKPGTPLKLAFRAPVRMVAYGPDSAHLTRHVLAAPSTEFSFPETTSAGTVAVAAAPRPWERPAPTLVSWFPSGAEATAVATPAPGSSISPSTGITLTFSKAVRKVLGTSLPPVSPRTSGTWQTINSHTIRYQPTGYGYGLGAAVTVGLPAGIRLVGGQPHGSDPIGRWSVPAGTTMRLQQLLAQLGYLPVDFKPAGAAVQPTLAAQVAAAIKAPAGSFSWRYPNVPAPLRSDWAPGAAGVVTRGAVMAFESDHGIISDGVAGPEVWKALIDAAMKGQHSSFGYTFVMVSEASPESIDVWHNGHTVLAAAVNTGIAAAPTATGTYPVFEHLAVTTMSGTNPDGSHYSDPGIPWVSYFNGGDALHGFIRGSYGTPQSLGCVEMPFATAGRVYPYTPIGTLVRVA